MWIDLALAFVEVFTLIVFNKLVYLPNSLDCPPHQENLENIVNFWRIDRANVKQHMKAAKNGNVWKYMVSIGHEKEILTAFNFSWNGLWSVSTFFCSFMFFVCFFSKINGLHKTVRNCQNSCLGVIGVIPYVRFGALCENNEGSARVR